MATKRAKTPPSLKSKPSGRRVHTNSCLVTMVAVDSHGRPSPVPGLLLETPDDKERWAAAEARHARRKSSR